MTPWRVRFDRFLFAPEPNTWLAILRIGLGIQVLLYTISLRNDWHHLFGGEGLIDGRLAEAILSLDSPLVPRLGWLSAAANGIGISESVALLVAFLMLLSAGLALTAGIFSRPSAIVAWVFHLAAAKTGGFVSYGVDNFMTIGLFYLMLSPLPDRYAFDRWWKKDWTPEDRQSSGFIRRVLQLHLCLIYFFGGLTKSLGSGWWDGSNLWRALTREPFNVIPPEMLVQWRYFFPAVGALICLLELSYAFLIWNRRTRLFCLLAIIAMHMMIGLTMGMYLFALVMIVLNLAAFGPDFAFRIDFASGWFKKLPVKSVKG